MNNKNRTIVQKLKELCVENNVVSFYGRLSVNGQNIDIEARNRTSNESVNFEFKVLETKESII